MKTVKISEFDAHAYKAILEALIFYHEGNKKPLEELMYPSNLHPMKSMRDDLQEKIDKLKK